MKIGNWRALPSLPFNQTGMRQIFFGENMTLARHVMNPGFPAYPHSHPHEQIIFVLEGRCSVTIGDEKTGMGPGDMVLVPPDALHDIEVVGEETVVLIDIFSPARKDFVEMFEEAGQ